MTILEQIFETYPDELFLKADGYDDAVIGVYDDSFNTGKMKLVYSVSKCIEILMKDNDMEYSVALEFFEFNTLGAYVGDDTPIWCQDHFLNG